MSDHIEDELRRLSDLHVESSWNESDVREEVLAPLIRLLGYKKGSDCDINREEHLLLHPFLMRGSERVRIDYAVVIRRRHFWILEAKRPGTSIEASAIHQAYFYATHPEVQARFFAVSNGREFRVYDVREIDERYAPTLSFSLSDLTFQYPTLRDLIGSDRVRETLARRALRDLQAVVATEIRRERIDDLDRELRTLVAKGRETVEDNSRAMARERHTQRNNDIRTAFPQNSAAQIARVAFEFLETPNDFALVFSSFREKLLALPDDARRRTIRDTLDVLALDLTSTHRLKLVQALMRIAPDLDDSVARRIHDCVRSEISRILFRFPADERARLLWTVEGLVKRVPYKLSMVQTATTEALARAVERKLAILSDADIVTAPPSIWVERHTWSWRRASELFRRFTSAPTVQLPTIISELEGLEREVEPAYQAATRRDFDGEPTPPTYTYFDKPLDCYRSVLFHTLLDEFDLAISLLGDDEERQIDDILRGVKEDAYCINHADTFWARLAYARGRMDPPNDPASGLPLSDESLRMFMARPNVVRLGISAVDAGVLIWGQIGDDRWAEYRAQINLVNRRLEVSTGAMRR